ncbi:extracellular solute-binding protein family 1 [[Leptolyngbya] sp. PCC 7376]|uniref:substrate-binding domain-containing protein n=1 Tax=[Leptolyngbya] sp. PCC 7376 TaxID=111781 RepID=UPI00029F07A5|nr:substrate-binding domain-containing protein [[Leptolyngbya] sp. PCC 7376]AFY39305.1 extracellular solute-binding protein family 1 [[Leptolyngbya] sp. PCC 7376]
MSSRRQFLVSAGTVTLASMLGGCGAPKESRLQFRVLEGSISPQVLKAFRRSYPDHKRIKFKPVDQLAKLFEDLKKIQETTPENYNKRFPWQSENPPIAPDLVTIGNGWFKEAIAAELLQPLAVDQLETWQDLDEPWRTFIEEQSGKTYGIPYRWGTTLLLYRKDKLKKFDWQLTDWEDLWREELKNKISLLDHSREVIGFVLKNFGFSYNDKDPEAIAGLSEELGLLHRNVKFYSSTHYLQPLITGDTWVAQAWSQDALSLMKRYRNLGAVVPKSGTALWCDLWVQPKKSEREFADLKPWLEFCANERAINQFAQSTFAASPLIYQTENLDAKVTENPLIFVNPETYQNSEIIETLPPSTEAQYQTLWQQMRQA